MWYWIIAGLIVFAIGWFATGLFYFVNYDFDSSRSLSSYTKTFYNDYLKKNAPYRWDPFRIALLGPIAIYIGKNADKLSNLRRLH